MGVWSVEGLVFITEKYFSCGESVVKAQIAFMKRFGIKHMKNVPPRNVILRSVKNFRNQEVLGGGGIPEDLCLVGVGTDFGVL